RPSRARRRRSVAAPRWRAPARSSSRPSRAITTTGSTRPRSAPRASRWRPRAPPPWWLSRRDACCSSTASAAWGGRMPRASRSSVSDVGAGAPAIMLVAGEASGDLHGAALCRALQAARPGCRLFGMGGARMASAGMELLVDVTAAAATGASEAVGRVPMLYRAYRRLRAVLQGAGRPRVLVVIDFPEFNLRLARAARRAGVPVVYFIPPQIWAWRGGRVKTIRRRGRRSATPRRHAPDRDPERQRLRRDTRVRSPARDLGHGDARGRRARHADGRVLPVLTLLRAHGAPPDPRPVVQPAEPHARPR